MGRPLNSDGRETREAIVDAALDAFAERGFHATSVKDIAALVGVRDSALYRYFTSKEELLDTVLAERFPQTEKSTRLSQQEHVVDLRDVLEKSARASLAMMEQPRAVKVFRVLMSDGLRLHAEKRVNLLRYYGDPTITAFFERMIAEKKLREGGDPTYLAVEYVAPFHSLMMLRLLQPDHPAARDLDAFARAHVDQFLRGAAGED